MKQIIFLILFTIVFVGCYEKEQKEIKIGFIAGLTGKYSSLGTDVRNGFLLAFDEINYKIKDAKINIIQKDDKQDPQIAKKIIEEFIADDIKLIVGNTTSSMTKVSIPIVNKQKDTLLISASASSSEFLGADDNFLRIQMALSKKLYDNFVKYLIKIGVKNISFIYDSKNKSYVRNYEKNFQTSFVELGGNSFINSIDVNKNEFSDILKQINSKNSDLILIVANSFDSSKLVQYLRINGIKTKIACAAWAKTPDFIENGGKAVDGVIFNAIHDENSKNKEFLDFREKYKALYGVKPSVFSAQAYELGKILIKELDKEPSLENMKNRILTTKIYEGLQGKIEFDSYGDVLREYFIVEIKNGEFVKIKKD